MGLPKLLKAWGDSSPRFSQLLISWYRAHQKDWPWRTRFLQSGDPYAVWVSEIMLQQTTIQAVLPAYNRFMETFPNVYRLAKASEDEVREACRGLGYYRRFRMMHEAAKVLTYGLSSETEAVSWPKDFRAWKELPGIGDYTAAAISSIAFAYPKAVVDGNVERVFARLFNLPIIVDAKWKKVFQEVGDALIPSERKSDPSDFNQGLMELGQTVCIKGQPRCNLCPVSEFCAALRENTTLLVPLPKPKLEFEDVRIHIFIQEKRGRIGLLQRSEKARFLKGTWSFPSAIESKEGSLVWETPNVSVEGAESLGRVKHGITKHKIDGLVSRLSSAQDVPSMKWFSEDEIEAKLVSNLDRKAFDLYRKLKRKKDRAPLENFFPEAPL